MPSNIYLGWKVTIYEVLKVKSDLKYLTACEMIHC